MSKRTKTNKEKETTAKTNTGNKRKKSYGAPQLVVYGNLSQVTRAKPGTKQDPSTHGRSRA